MLPVLLLNPKGSLELLQLRGSSSGSYMNKQIISRCRKYVTNYEVMQNCSMYMLHALFLVLCYILATTTQLSQRSANR